MGQPRIRVDLALLRKAVARGWSLDELQRRTPWWFGRPVSKSTLYTRLAAAGLRLVTWRGPVKTAEARARTRERAAARKKQTRRNEVRYVKPAETWTRACLRCGSTVTIPRTRWTCDRCFKENMSTRPGVYGAYGTMRRGDAFCSRAETGRSK